MKQFVFSIALFLCIATAAQNRYDKEPLLVKPLTGGSIQSVEAATSGGGIAVSGVDGNARVEVYAAPVNGQEVLSKEDLQKRLDDNYNLTISVEGSKLLVSAKPKDKDVPRKERLSISWKVFVPRNVSTQLQTSGGGISLAHLSGNQNFTTNGGSLQVEDVSGKITGRTSGGSIQVENSKDEIELATSGGSIEARNCEGNVKLITSGGSLSLVNLNGTIRAVTSGGSVIGRNIEGELTTSTLGGSMQLSNLACSLDAATKGGQVDVSFTSLGKFVKINNGNGNVDLELPKNGGVDLQLSAAKIKTPELQNFSGRAGEEEVKGKWNGGGVTVTVTANDGRIYLSQK